MKENIATIPLIKAFNAKDECPFCNLEREAEQHAVSFILGSAYMEDDIREKTDATGFCRHHFKSSLLKRMKRTDATAEHEPQTALGAWISKKTTDCYVCDHFRKIYGRYLDTFFDLYLKNEEFRQLFEESKGFCLPHFGALLAPAEHMERLQKEVAWFVEKNDYRNKDKDWGNSADSIQRGMQKCAGGYPADEVFRAKL